MDARFISAFTRVFDALLPAHDGLKEPANRRYSLACAASTTSRD
jgi:hypothetical protein